MRFTLVVKDADGEVRLSSPMLAYVDDTHWTITHSIGDAIRFRMYGWFGSDGHAEHWVWSIGSIGDQMHLEKYKRAILAELTRKRRQRNLPAVLWRKWLEKKIENYC